MYEPISDLSNRVVLDANVVLNLLFVRESHSYRSVRYLLAMGYTLLCPEQVATEARRRIRRLEHKYPTLGPLERELDLGLKEWPVVFLPIDATDPSLSNTPRHDRHVATTARQNCAWVLTTDCGLNLGAQRDGVPTRFPTDVIHSYRKGQPPLDEVFRLHSLAQDEGCIFARVSPGAWAGIYRFSAIASRPRALT